MDKNLPAEIHKESEPKTIAKTERVQQPQNDFFASPRLDTNSKQQKTPNMQEPNNIVDEVIVILKQEKLTK